MRLIILIAFLATSLFAQVSYKKSFKLAAETADIPQTFLGNAVIDLIVNQDEVWASTGFGLNKTTDEGESWQVFQSADYLAKGGVSAMALMGDSVLWIATAFDTTVRGDNLDAGGGLSYTKDGGLTWQHINQPVDSPDETEYSPTTTKIQNLIYDIAVLDNTIWIASFGGGLRRSDDMGANWQVVTTDGKPFSSLAQLNHRAFSLLSENGNIWFGSAEGISKSSDNGQTWQRFTSTNQDFPISGNFVVAMAYQEATNTVWAATVEALEQGEIRGVSKTSNGGVTWDVVLEGVFAHNFGFDGENVYVASDLGLFISDDGGENWYQLPPVVDTNTGEEVLKEEYFSVATQLRPDYSRLWFGSQDGLVTTKDNGRNWNIIRSFISTNERKKPKVYAYPSPFSPSRSGYTRFQYDIKGDTDVEIKIYNFGMEHVATVRESEANFSDDYSDRSAKWNGRDANGKLVATGVYFFRAKVADKVTWGKVVVIN